MALFCSFHLTGALLLVLVHQRAAGKTENFDLDEAVERTVKRRAKIYNVKAIWWDMYRTREEVKTYGNHFPPVTATAGDVVYGATKSSAKRPSIVYTQWVRNEHASLSKNATVKRKIERKKTATWNVEAGFSYTGSLTASAKIYFVNYKTQHQISLDLKGGYREEISDTETFWMNVVIPVPPMKSIKLDWIITDTVKEVFWTSPVTLTGYFFVKYRSSYIPESKFLGYSSLHFLSKDHRFKHTGNNTYLYNAKGTFTGVTAKESEIRVSEYEYHAYGGRSSAVRIYTIPLSLTPYTPTANTV